MVHELKLKEVSNNECYEIKQIGILKYLEKYQ